MDSSLRIAIAYKTLVWVFAVAVCAVVAPAGEPAPVRFVHQRVNRSDDQGARLPQNTGLPENTGLLDNTGPFADWSNNRRRVRYGRDFDHVNNNNDGNSGRPLYHYSLTPAPGITAPWDSPPTVGDPSIEFLPQPPEAAADTRFERLPPVFESESGGPLPAVEPLPDLADELYLHGGSYLYCPEGDRLGWPGPGEAHYEYLRLPESWQKPLPLTAFAEFLGADAVKQYPLLKWFGPCGDAWEPRFVGHGDYQVFAFAFEANQQRSDAVGHQLRVDLDLRLTGTERFHVQFRPLGRGGSGGSYYQFNDPSGYIDNSTGEPDRYWFEGELYSIFSSYFDPFAVRDYHIVAGKFPLFLHNFLLINDEILGAVVSKNTIYGGSLSNLNVQVITGFNDVDTYPNEQTRIYGLHATADCRRMLFEGTYLYGAAENDSSRDAHYLGFSGTRLIGPWTTAVRALFKIGDEGGEGSGQLFVVENNFTRVWDSKPCGVEYGVFYANVFGATEGWNSLGGSNFNRLRSAFEVNPLVAISAGRAVTDDVWGVSTGVQLFRHHEDESIIPEVAFQSPAGEPVWGVGVRYLRKTSRRTFFELLGVANFSDDAAYRREGVFAAETIVF